MAPRPLRILHVTAAATGAPWMIALAEQQKLLGHDVAAVIPSRDGTIAPELEKRGIPVHLAALDFLSVSSLRRVRSIVALVRLFRRLRPDVVHSHLLPSVLMTRIAAYIADVPIRFGANAGPLTLESEALGALEIGTAFCDTRTIASCSYVQELFAKAGVDASLVYYAVDHARFDPALADGARVRRELGVAPETPLVGMVAYFYPPLASANVYPAHLLGRGPKGHDVLLRAMPRVLAAVPDAKLALVGRGWGPEGVAYEQTLRRLARELGVEHAVLFTGERTDVPDTLAALDVSVHPSLNDNLGGTAESLLMARPMVVSDIGGYRDTIVEGETGLTVPACDAPALADAIVRLLRDRDFARRLGENGRKRMLGGFTLAHTTAAVEQLIANERPEGRYRVGTMLRRALAMPFRLLPIAWRVRRILRRIPPKTRIAQIAGTWANGDWLIGICRGLAARGFDVVAVIDAKPGTLGDRLAGAGIKTFKLPMTFAAGRQRGRALAYLLHVPIAAFQLARLLRRERIAIAHSHIFGSVVIARLAAKLARARHVAGIAGPRHLEASLTRRIDRLTWRLDDVTLAGCQHTRELYAALGRDAEVVYYGADAERFNPALANGDWRVAIGGAESANRHAPIANRQLLIVHVAHFYPPTTGPQTPRHTLGRGPKGHEDLLAAARIVLARYPEARFVLAGEGVLEAGAAYRERLMAQCQADEVLRDRVLFPGFVEDVPSLLAAADVAVQCSLTENLGGTIEALLMECPVVATRVGGMPESVRDGETGLLVPPSDPASLAAAILRLLDDRELAKRLGQAGRQLMLERFTLARTVEDLDALYRRLMP